MKKLLLTSIAAARDCRAIAIYEYTPFCNGPGDGGKLILTAKGSVTERTEVNLIYRVKYRTKEGDRQIGGTYIVTLVP